MLSMMHCPPWNKEDNSRNGVLEDWPRPQGHLGLEEPWPWPRRRVALALRRSGRKTLNFLSLVNNKNNKQRTE